MAPPSETVGPGRTSPDCVLGGDAIFPRSPPPAPSPVTPAAGPMAAAEGGPARGAEPGAPGAGAPGVNAPARVRGERLRCPSSRALGEPRWPGTAKMSASLVRATVRAVSKRKLQPIWAALTLKNAYK
ncbi:multifunctional 2-oxoglutarate metabolism enzyme-like isoform X1 [Oryctolagus cuniculus]|uniref:multifunctional 2-oxoglutarate metabolism enzyme-like isoform X1 n=1 Tax=Oryctolagus cuniculus TaxID=9986 RepID=UPI00387A4525